MKKKIVVIAMLALTVIACDTSKKNENTAAQNEKILIDSSWDLVTLKGKAISKPDNSSEKIYFNMKADDKAVNGFGGCNNFMGSYTLEENNHIKFSSMGSTRKACPGLEVDESEVLNIFEESDKYTLKGDKLTLSNSTGEDLAVFEKAEKMKSEETKFEETETTSEITEKYWKLKTLEGQKVEMAENQEEDQYFMLKNDDNRVQGFSGCNSFSGEFTLEKGERIRFSQMASTMRACPDVDVDESAFLEIFELADNYRINGDELELNVGRRAPLAVFEAVHFD